MSASRSLPLRAVFRVWREFALPDDFEDSVVAQHPHLFRLAPNPSEPNTHILQLVADPATKEFTPAVEKTRSDKYAFKLQFPPGFRLTKEYRKKVKEWQLLPYVGPYEVVSQRVGGSKRVSKAARRRMEKRAVGIAYEFLSLTVEKMVEVEKFSQFRKWFGIEVNVRDVFLDHPGIFYLSANTWLRVPVPMPKSAMMIYRSKMFDGLTYLRSWSSKEVVDSWIILFSITCSTGAWPTLNGKNIDCADHGQGGLLASKGMQYTSEEKC